MGQDEFYGNVLLATPLAPAFSRRRLIGDSDMQIIAAVWDHAHTAERPLDPEEPIVTINRQRVGRIGLQLDGVGAGSFRRLEDPDRLLKVLPMVGGHFRNNISGLAWTNPPAIDFNRRFHTRSRDRLGHRVAHPGSYPSVTEFASAIFTNSSG